jgi:hypothetical protein
LKKILILYPHYPPSNLVGVHRIRLFVQHLEKFNWQPTILTVHENFYEENLDYNLEKLHNPKVEIVKVTAFKTTNPRLIGDIGLRAFFQLYRKAKALIKENNYDFLLCSIPSFYCALLGRLLHQSTGIKYGIDYQDPWVHYFPGSNKIFSRHWFSTKIAKFLEPIAVKKVSLITGVAESYYLPVLQRNTHLHKIISGYMPMGGEQKDFDIISTLNLQTYLFQKNKNKFVFVYAGALLPNAVLPLEKVFDSISKNIHQFENIEFHFIGTGKVTTDKTNFTVKKIAEKYKIWNEIIFEYPARIPYLDVLVHLNIADGVFILGSTESHYTPSKVYQAILSKKPILAVLHKESSAVNLIEESNAGKVVSFSGIEGIDEIYNNFCNVFNEYKIFESSFLQKQVNKEMFTNYSAFAITEKLSNLLNQAIQKN